MIDIVSDVLYVAVVMIAVLLILIILMQNYTHESCLEDAFNSRPKVPHASISNLSPTPPPPHCTIGGIFFDFTKDIGIRLLKFSLKNEIRWIRFRIKS